jgi:peptidyl-prolyl cis-trans isomerase B (cyclophilin B)
MNTLLILLVTTLGNITIELDQSKAPQSVDNFVQYVNEGHYNGTQFHRVIDGFMVQGGGFTADMKQKPTRAPVPNEADNGLKNVRGTVAMARTGDPHSATAQFFINTVNNGFLDHKAKTQQGWGYTVIGRVTEGMDVVDRISKTRTGTKMVQGHPLPDVPVETVLIKEARVISASAPAAAPAAAAKTPERVL